MTSQVGLREFDGGDNNGATAAKFACSLCTAFEADICQAPRLATSPSIRTSPIRQSTHLVPARRIICRGQDLHDMVPVICSGWAAAIVMLSDGSRQIVSFLLPGDMISTTLLFETRPYWLVEAITDVNFRTFNRTDLRSLVYDSPDRFDFLFKAWVEEKSRADQLIVDLGRRTADERIARLIHGLVERLARRDMVRDNPTEFEFPLRQHHIADATGLTPVHVSKVLTEFRRKGLININERSMTILDPEGFGRIANMR
ncbi:MAG TPA: Crp/Fnr family transcriptional regulator [Pseudolabrys sp.]|jgi:CRP-like cAMP-binding protein|nr:Crp/Fnr family transcriptional regulator [Pseudolabrys sp.]